MSKIIGGAAVTPIRVPDAASAIKGSASGNPIVLSDVSPLPHGIAVHVDVNGATVHEFGKNLVDVDQMLNGNLTKDENGVYRISKAGAKSYKFPTQIPANPSFVISYKNLDGYNANSNAVISHSIYFADGTNEGGNWIGGNWLSGKGIFENKIVITKEKPVTGFNINVYNPSADFHCSFTGLQVEIGKNETDLVPFKHEPHTATDGNLSIIGNGQSMTLIAEDGVTMDVEYNIDTKKYIDKKFAELQALVLEV